MKKNIFFLFLNFFILLGCENNSHQQNSSSSVEVSHQISSSYIRSYTDYKEQIIPLKEMFSQSDELYGVYFYSVYCPACASLKETLFDYLDISNKCIDNLYLINIGETNEEDFNKLKSGNGLYEEEIINNTIGAKSIEETYFRTSPCMYIIKKIDSINTIIDFYLNYQDVADFLLNNTLK